MLYYLINIDIVLYDAKRTSIKDNFTYDNDKTLSELGIYKVKFDEFFLWTPWM